MNRHIHKIRYGILAASSIALIFIVAGFFILNRIENSFIQMQKEATVQNIKIVEGIFRREQESLSINALDWSMWDGMHDFVSSPTEEFLESEFQDQTFSEINSDVVLIKNFKETLFAKQVYNQKPEETAVPEEILAVFSEMWPVGEVFPPNLIKNKIIKVGSRKILLASRQITRSDGSGPVAGMLLFGRYMEEGFLNEFDNVPGFYFNIFPYSPNSSGVVEVSPENPLVVNLEGVRRVRGAKLLKGAEEEEEDLVLEIEHVPTVYSRLGEFISMIALGIGMAYLLTFLAMMLIFSHIARRSSLKIELNEIMK